MIILYISSFKNSLYNAQNLQFTMTYLQHNGKLTCRLK